MHYAFFIMSDNNTVSLLNKNTLTTAGVLVGGSTVLTGGVLLTAVLPAQVLTAAAVSGGLIYAGHRQHSGKDIIPSFKKDETPAVEAAE